MKRLSRFARLSRSVYWWITDQIRAMPEGLLLYLLAIGGAWMVVLTVGLWSVIR